MKRWIFALVLCLVAATAGATRISLLTAYPGAEIFQLEGHTGLRIVDDSGSDVVINWGVFDFNAPNFVGRFVAGQTDYFCWPFPTKTFLDEYEREGRMVVEQVLDLDSLQTERLLQAVTLNLQPRNRVYRYNYVLDNCATRPMALIEEAVGRQLLSDSLTSKTFRNEMRRFHKDYPWYQFGIDLALGRNLDRPILERQAAFAPLTLMLQIGETDIVSDTKVYGRQQWHSTPTPWYLSPLAVAFLVLLLSIWFCLKPAGAKWFDSALFTVQFLTGCVIAYLVFVSTHEATSPNLLLLWLNPLCILGVILPWIKSAGKAEMLYFFVNFALLIILIILSFALRRGMNPAFWPLIVADAVRSMDRFLECRNAIKRS